MKSRRGGVVGRETELERLGTFAAGFSPQALVLAGGPGFGKTTLWETGVELARERGVRVATASPSGAEAQLSFAALIDLCDGLETSGLPAPQRTALEVALLRREPDRAPPEPHAIGLALRHVMAAHAPILVAVDDVQWLDGPSADALAFAARRLTGEPVGYLLSRRPGTASALEQALERRTLEVGALSANATRRLLAERLGLRVPAPLLKRIVDATLGNPLFALEVGRVLADHGLPDAGADLPVPAAVEDMLGTRVAGLPRAARRLLLATALGEGLHVDVLEAIGGAAAVEDALDAGLLRADGDRVDAAHPLLAAAARQHARPKQRRALHAALAAAVREPEQRALHLALAAQEPDAALATEVETAAAHASARGARPEAVALAEQALRLTPVGDERRSERLLTLAGYCENAGERQRVTDVLTPELDSLPREARVRAWLLLSEGGAVLTRADRVAHLERALEEAGDELALRGRVLALKALTTAAEGVERIHEAEAWALEAFPAGPGADCLALRALGWTRSLSGQPIDEIDEQFRALTAHAVVHLVDSPGPVAALRLAWRGEIEPARAATTGFLAVAAERGEGVAHAWLRLNLCELELRAGEWDAASRLLDEWAASDDGQFLITPTYQRCRALLAAGRGLAGEAERWAAPALAEAEARGFRWQTLEASRALGLAALLEHDPALAAQRFGAVWHHTQREGIDEPGAFPVAPDLVESLVELGARDEARTVAARLRTLAEAQEHPWGLASAWRCEALIDDPAGLADAADAYERLGLRFDAARTRLSLGRAQRRARQWGNAREAIERAAADFDTLDSPGWAGQARAELARVGGRRPRAPGELTQTEQQVAALAADGRTNKEIAQALFVTVHTVEAHLSSTYAKLGVSRAQLASHPSVPT